MVGTTRTAYRSGTMLRRTVISRSAASRKSYAEAVFHVLEFVQTDESPMALLANRFGGKSSTERRFEMIANSRVTPSPFLVGLPAAIRRCRDAAVHTNDFARSTTGCRRFP